MQEALGIGRGDLKMQIMSNVDTQINKINTEFNDFRSRLHEENKTNLSSLNRFDLRLNTWEDVQTKNGKKCAILDEKMAENKKELQSNIDS